MPGPCLLGSSRQIHYPCRRPVSYKKIDLFLRQSHDCKFFTLPGSGSPAISQSIIRPGDSPTLIRADRSEGYTINTIKRKEIKTEDLRNPHQLIHIYAFLAEKIIQRIALATKTPGKLAVTHPGFIEPPAYDTAYMDILYVQTVK